MAATHRQTLRTSRIFNRLVALRTPLAVTVIVLVVLWLMGALSILPAVAAFVLIALAIVFGTQVIPEPRSDTQVAVRDLRGVDLWFLDPVLAALPQPVIALDSYGNVLALNAPARVVAPGLREGEAVSIGLRVPDVLNAIRHATTNNIPQRVEFTERIPVERWYEAIVVPVSFSTGASGAVSQLVVITLDDLTPLRRIDEMRADFVANASHELRTPLAALSGFIETMQGPAREDPEARTRFLAIMQAQAARMARLIDDLLSLSRIELNAHLRPNKPVELGSIVRQVVDGLQTLARDREVDVKVSCSPDRIVVPGDRDELLRVFENLVENALKYAASGKRLDIALSADPVKADARVVVRDFGPGIAPEHLPRLTERFYRVDVADSRAQGGTGLGLALVKHILNRHGGRLTIESAAGQGATFTAYLPLAKGMPTQA